MDYDPRSGSDKGKPDYQKCVAISTAAAQKELMSPAVLAVSAPILVGFGLGYGDPLRGAAALGGFLAGAILTGQLMAVFLSNTGGLWDNAKKKIEDGMFGGKGTPEHKAARRRRHRRRSVQGHRRPGAEPADQGHEPGRDPGRTDSDPSDLHGRADSDRCGRGSRAHRRDSVEQARWNRCRCECTAIAHTVRSGTREGLVSTDTHSKKAEVI